MVVLPSPEMKQCVLGSGSDRDRHGLNTALVIDMKTPPQKKRRRREAKKMKKKSKSQMVVSDDGGGGG